MILVSVVTLKKSMSVLFFVFLDLKDNLVDTGTQAVFFVCFFTTCLLCIAINLNFIWCRHVSHLAFRNKLLFAISVVPHRQNQASIQILVPSLPNSESFVRKAIISIVAKSGFSPLIYFCKKVEKLIYTSIALMYTINIHQYCLNIVQLRSYSFA